jgi:Domain of unknown function (DUF4145)
MAVNRNLWSAGLRKGYAPSWPCLSCSNGTLRLIRDSLRWFETTESQRRHTDEDFSIFDIDYTFSGSLKCDGCGQKISCCGTGGEEPYTFQNEDGDWEQEYETVFYPRFFYTSLHLFRAPPRCPRLVREQLHKSFAVFFCDLSAAANHLRQCVEEILTDAGIDIQDAKGGFIRLNDRIKIYEERDSDNAERITALKWIGNCGSHPEDDLRKPDLFDAYDILEVLLEDLYVGHNRNVRNIVAQINAAKGPRR